MNVAKTQGIEICCISIYVPERSKPSQNYYFYSYTIRITNRSTVPAKLISRHWYITDGIGKTHEVKGDGVVGEQPRLLEGQSFEYTSFCPLPTQVGAMIGEYIFRRDDLSEFKAQVPNFTLLCPDALQ